jgi:hypothetical protein
MREMAIAAQIEHLLKGQSQRAVKDILSSVSARHNLTVVRTDKVLNLGPSRSAASAAPIAPSKKKEKGKKEDKRVAPWKSDSEWLALVKEREEVLKRAVPKPEGEASDDRKKFLEDLKCVEAKLRARKDQFSD